LTDAREVERARNKVSVEVESEGSDEGKGKEVVEELDRIGKS